ncbi:MAG: 50S ribosomal protein L23 [Gemmatimonadetes bacterium]|nr:50S ribosomal protein L23 [Gemmatimonadota bacterium]
MDSRTVLRRPLLTEKATIAREIANEYAFEIDPRANKIDVKRAVEKLFEVKVKSVRTVNRMGKMKRMGAHQGRRAAWKKALVTLEEGNTLDLFEGM